MGHSSQALPYRTNIYTDEKARRLLRRLQQSFAPEPIQWNEQTFFSKLELTATPEELAVARRLFEWIQSNCPPPHFARGNIDGSFYPLIDKHFGSHALFCVWTTNRIEIPFEYLSKTAFFATQERCTELLRRLNTIPGINLPEFNPRKRPNMLLNLFLAPEELNKLLETFSWILNSADSSAGLVQDHAFPNE